MRVGGVVAVGVWAPLADNIIWHPSPNKGYGDAQPWWRAVTWHIAEGSLDATLSWLCDPASNASAHIVIARNGDIYNLVPLTEPAWAQGNVCKPDLSNPIVAQTVTSGVNPNLRSYSIECVGYSTYGKPGALTAPQAAALVRATGYLCLRAHLTVDRAHVLGHCQWDSCTRSGCPGYAPSEWDTWIAAARHLCLLWRGW